MYRDCSFFLKQLFRHLIYNLKTSVAKKLILFNSDIKKKKNFARPFAHLMPVLLQKKKRLSFARLFTKMSPSEGLGTL